MGFAQGGFFLDFSSSWIFLHRLLNDRIAYKTFFVKGLLSPKNKKSP